MRTLAVGSNVAPTLATACAALPPRGAFVPWGGPAALIGAAPTLAKRRGFTLLELLVVLAIIAIATAGVSLAMRDSSTTALEREGARLAALLESGRIKSRATGLAVIWQATEGGFGFFAAAPHPGESAPVAGKVIDKPILWLDPQIRAVSPVPVLLGPEPIIAAQAITLAAGNHTLRIASDGLRPFAVSTAAPEVP
jgi:general secretion pathway protein H